jgi:hypothetical protein
MKAPYVLMNRFPIGGLGNQLFQYNFMAQLAHRTGVKFLHSGYPNLETFGIQKQSKMKSLILGLKASEISLADIDQIGWSQCINLVQSNLERKRSVRIKPGILGEYYKEVTTVDPKEFIKIESGLKNRKQTPFLAIHFRGSDFYGWNARAVMDTRYYKDAIESIVSKKPNQFDIRIFSEDRESKVVKELEKEFRCQVSDGSEREDFLEIANAEVIIASPSTFVFWSAVLGNCQEIYYSKGWLSYATEQGMKFWIDLRSGTLPYFPNVREV